MGTLDSANPNFGLEAIPTTGSSGANACPGTIAVGACGSQQECLQNRSFRGVVPWRTLGISQEAATDPWYRFYTYQVSVSAIVNPFDDGNVVGIQYAQAMVGNMPIHSAVPVSLANQVNVGNEAVAVLLSHGEDGLGAYIPGGQMTQPSGATQLENANATRAFVDAEFSRNDANPNDDLLAFYSVGEMLDGGVFPTPGLETMTGRVKYLAEMLAGASTVVGSCPPALPGACTYRTPGTLSLASVPLPFQYDSKGTQIVLTGGAGAATPTALSFQINGSTQTVSANEFWNIGVRIGAFH